jgi:hypothetical protein
MKELDVGYKISLKLVKGRFEENIKRLKRLGYKYNRELKGVGKN